MQVSDLERARQSFQLKLPSYFRHLHRLHPIAIDKRGNEDAEIVNRFPLTSGQPFLHFEEKEETPSAPLHIAAVFSGGQASGGHNVLSGIFDAVKQLHPESTLIGFLDGPEGIVQDQALSLTKDVIERYRNQGGFDLLGSGRTKIETEAQFQAALATVEKRKLDGLVIIGGDDSNTNALMLAEYFQEYHCKTTVVGVPKTIDGDLKNADVEISFGFDTATKMFAHEIGSIARDALSAKKYYFFIKLMGRSASHITLECALATHPNCALIGEEVAANHTSLKEIIHAIANLIEARAKKGKQYGVVLIPEGLIEFVPEVGSMIQELNRLVHEAGETFAEMPREDKIASVLNHFSEENRSLFSLFPKQIQAQLLLERDPHGNVQVSKIETERLLISMVKRELKERKVKGFSAQPLFCGYEGRSCLPSNFDAHYCYLLGCAATLLMRSGATGYMGVVQGLSREIGEWKLRGVPLASMMTFEERKGKHKPVIRKALVDLEGPVFAAFKEQRQKWQLEDLYRNPGPLQFFGPAELTDEITHTLKLEHA